MNPSSFLLSLGEPLPESLMINGKAYSTVKIIKGLEQIINQRILLVTGGIQKNFRNVTIEFSIIKPHSLGEPLIIIGKENLIKIW